MPKVVEPKTKTCNYDSALAQGGWVQALCIGVDEYTHLSQLGNCVRDATAIAQKVQELPGRSAAVGPDQEPQCKNSSSKHALQKVLMKFLSGLVSAPPRVVLVYFAGHGIRTGGKMFLVPANAKLEAAPDLEQWCMSLDDVWKLLKTELEDKIDVGDVLFLVILDMCQNLPRNLKQGSTEESLEPDVQFRPKFWALCTAAARGQRAQDGDAGGHSPFNSELLSPQCGLFEQNVSIEHALNLACGRLRARGQEPHVFNMSNLDTDLRKICLYGPERSISEQHDVFICFREDEKGCVEHLARALQDGLMNEDIGRGGESRKLRVFRKPQPGRGLIKHQVADALCSSQVVILLVSHSTLKGVGQMRKDCLSDDPLGVLLAQYEMILELHEQRRVCVLPLLIGSESATGRRSFYQDFDEFDDDELSQFWPIQELSKDLRVESVVQSALGGLRSDFQVAQGLEDKELKVGAPSILRSPDGQIAHAGRSVWQTLQVFRSRQHFSTLKIVGEENDAVNKVVEVIKDVIKLLVPPSTAGVPEPPRSCTSLASSGLHDKGNTSQHSRSFEGGNSPVPSDTARALPSHPVNPEMENISRFTREEMKNTWDAVAEDSVPPAETMVCHYTDVKSAELIMQPSSRGFRASTVGQAGGGFYVVVVPPHEMGWEKYQGGAFRATVGRELWGEKASNVLLGGCDAHKLDVVFLIKVPRIWIERGRGVPGRPAIKIIPLSFLYEHEDGFLYLQKQKIVKCYVLKGVGGSDESLAANCMSKTLERDGPEAGTALKMPRTDDDGQPDPPRWCTSSASSGLHDQGNTSQNLRGFEAGASNSAVQVVVADKDCNELVRFLKSKELSANAARFSEVMGMARVDQFKKLQAEDLDDPDLSFLKRWQKQELLELVQQITAASASLRDRQLDDSTRSAATTASERGETSDSEDEHLPTIVAAYSLGNAEDVLAHVKSGIIKDIMGPEDDQADEKLSLCTYLWVSFLRGAKYKSRDAKKREIEDWMKELFVPQKAHLYDEEIAEKVHGFLDHVVEHKLLEEIRGKTRAYPRVPCVGAVAIIDKVVEYLLLRQSKDAKRWGTWQDEVVGTWYSSGNQTPRAFLLRANKFLRRHVDKETELMTYVTTWSYVAFMRMTSLASLLLFEYLEARKLQEAFTPGAAGRNISPFHGFRTFVSSSKRVFALTEADAPDARAMPIVQQGLRCLSRLSASAWEMLGPEKKAHALYDEAIARELEKDDSMLKDGSKMPCDALWEPEGGWDAAFLKVVGMLTSEKGLPAPKPLDPQEVLMASKDMDLTAIKGKVQQGRYLRYPGEFHDDAVLVFRVQLDHCRGEELEQPQLQAKSHEDMADLKLRCEAIWTTIKGELQSVVIDKDANAPLSSSEDLIHLSRKVVLAAVQQCWLALKDASEELRGDREVVLAAVQRNKVALQYASEELRGDREVMLTAVRQDGQQLEYASEELRGDREVVLAAVQQDGRALLLASKELRRDREVVLAAVQQDWRALQYASLELRGDREVVMAAVQQNGWVLSCASEELRGDREVVLAAVRQEWRQLEYASEELRGDREVVLAAVQQDGRALQYASEELRGDREVVLAAVRQEWRQLQYASEELRGDREVVLAAVQQKGRALQYASEELRGDREVVLAAVRQDGRGAHWNEDGYKLLALQYASKELRGDREVVLAAVQQDWRALSYASEELRGDREVVLAAVQQNGWVLDGRALLYVSKELRGDREVVLAAVQQNGKALEYASEELRGDREVVMAAVQQNGKALEYASKEMQKMMMTRD